MTQDPHVCPEDEEYPDDIVSRLRATARALSDRGLADLLQEAAQTIDNLRNGMGG